jgi:2-dehydro-3-deoxygalactonokinase
MHTFISCDWGTSTFRLRLVDPTEQTVLSEVTSNQGIAETFTLWKQEGHDDAMRSSFYRSFIDTHLAKLQQQQPYPLLDLPLIISGMASSNIGMVELPYKELPFAMDGSDLGFQKINASDIFRHDVIMISGAKTSKDVMRGEEIQLVGCDLNEDEERVYVLPGTHSKHVMVKNRKAIYFKTYMTGEFFHLLSTQSILAKSVQENSQPLNGEVLKSFEAGISESIHDNLLHNAFLVRTNHLLSDYSKDENYYYLSGLLIGTELKALVSKAVPVTIVGNESMRKYYLTALQKLGISDLETVDADQALVKGHCKVYHLFQNGNLALNTI